MFKCQPLPSYSTRRNKARSYSLYQQVMLRPLAVAVVGIPTSSPLIMPNLRAHLETNKQGTTNTRWYGATAVLHPASSLRLLIQKLLLSVSSIVDRFTSMYRIAILARERYPLRLTCSPGNQPSNSDWQSLKILNSYLYGSIILTLSKDDLTRWYKY